MADAVISTPLPAGLRAAFLVHYPDNDLVRATLSCPPRAGQFFSWRGLPCKARLGTPDLATVHQELQPAGAPFEVAASRA